MSGTLRITFLGTGTSHGVPMIGCHCRVCRSDDPRDKRNRTSVAVEVRDEGGEEKSTILIDTPPELRLAAIANGLECVDAVLITHAHADHILGMDDLRRYNNLRGGEIEVFADGPAIAILRTVFGYAERPYENPDRPCLRFREFAAPGVIAGVPVTPIPLLHGRVKVQGYRIGNFAYCTDCSEIPEASMDLLKGLDLLVLGALRYTSHPAHFNVEQALAAAHRLRPARVLFTHIAHEIAHAELAAKLPANIQPAYDGQRTEVAYN